jgi:hypothetical protein
MALATIIEGPTVTNIGTPFNPLGPNLPFRLALFNNITYSLTREDYHNGFIQFQTVFFISVAISNTVGIGFAEGAVNRREYGSYAISNQSGGVTKGGKLEYLNQAIVITSAQYPLARNASSRLRKQVLSIRPRFLMSNSAATNWPLNGVMAVAPGTTASTGTVAPGGGILTASGSFNNNGLTSAQIVAGSRTMKFDINDGVFETIDLEPPTGQYTGTPTNTLANIGEETKLDIYLLPGAVGTINKRVMKLGEPLGVEPSIGVAYVPGVFPAP